MTQQANENAVDAFDLNYDVSSVTDGMPEGFNDIAFNQEAPEFNTDSATDGLVEVEHGSDEDLIPDPKVIMDSFADNGGVVTDITKTSSEPKTAAKTAKKASSTSGKASPSASEGDGGSKGDDK